MIRILGSIVAILIIAYGGWHLANHNPTVKSFIQKNFDAGEFHTLEIRYNADTLMDMHRDELLKGENYTFLEPNLRFYPYLLMEVKYTSQDNTTGEGLILWGMDDGEMVTSTSTWEKTHGFEDCINAGADQNDFKIINALAMHGGLLNREDLATYIHVENDLLDHWIDSCKKKHLVVQNGTDYRLHFAKPKLQVIPETQIDHWLVTQPYKSAVRVNQRYSKSQIEKIASLAFGKDFAIRQVTEIFLPVFRLDVQNPDGSIYTTYWNALNGRQLKNHNPIL